MNPQVIEFLQQVSQNQNERSRLRFAQKTTVLETAQQNGFNFSENEYDVTLFAIEAKLAEYTKEEFANPNYSLWNLMWGQTYFDYLLDSLIPLTHLISLKG